MTTKSDLIAREAAHGQKMIEVKIRFFTDHIADEKGRILPKHAWTSGIVRMQSNKSHGIVPENPLPFDSLMNIPSAVEKVLINHGVILHPDRRMKKYLKS